MSRDIKKRVMNKDWRNMLIFMAVVFVIVIYLIIPTNNVPISQENIPDLTNTSYETSMNNSLPDVEEYSPDIILDTGQEFLMWKHMPITYKIYNDTDYVCDCPEITKFKIKYALEKISRDVPAISFQKVNSNEDLSFKCCRDQDAMNAVEVEAGYELWGLSSLQAKNGTIFNCTIYFPGADEGCDYYTTLHELLHCFGFEHSNDRGDIMYPVDNSCMLSWNESIYKDNITIEYLQKMVEAYKSG